MKAGRRNALFMHLRGERVCGTVQFIYLQSDKKFTEILHSATNRAVTLCRYSDFDTQQIYNRGFQIYEMAQYSYM